MQKLDILRDENKNKLKHLRKYRKQPNPRPEFMDVLFAYRR